MPQALFVVLERTLPLVLAAAGIFACLWLFFTIKREFREGERRRLNELEEIRQFVRSLERRLEREREEAELAGSRSLISNGMNFSKRSQALRLMRKGEDPERVAAALNLPTGEVQLLRKVTEIVTERMVAPTS